MRILILGAKGMLGREIQEMFTGKFDVYVDNRDTLDILNKKMVFKRIKEVSPDLVINCAAFTNIDQAENEIELSMQINGYAVEHIAKACEHFSSKLIQFSTNYVFDGTQDIPYTEDSAKYPQNVYGKSKSLGEDLATNYCSQTYIVRTSWLYGTHGNNFVNQMLELSKNNEIIKVINNQYGCPTWTKDLVYKIYEIIAQNPEYGIYHFANNGEATWHDFAKLIFSLKNINVQLTPLPDSEFKQKAKRPAYCVLENSKTEPLRDWEEAVQDYLGVY